MNAILGDKKDLARIANFSRVAEYRVLTADGLLLIAEDCDP